jgi:hypothetical protein
MGDMQKWEYMTMKLFLGEDPIEILNYQGLQGWQLVAVEHGIAYFMRPTEEN